MGVPMVGLHSKTSLTEDHYDIAIIGGGPAGSTAALYLARKGFRTCVVEKRIFPRETLCGEFLSREVVQIIENLQLSREFQSLLPNPITTFRFCPEDARAIASDLKFMAYGLKRGSFDTMLLAQAHLAGAIVYQPMTVEQVHKIENGYTLFLSGAEGKIQVRSRYVACAYGKSNQLDKILQRNIPERRSQLIGVKFHIHKRYLPSMPEHEIHIYAGHKMYCGVNVVNDDTITLCFLEDHSAADAQPRARIKELLKANHHFAELVSTDFIEMLSSFPIYGTTGIYFGTKHHVVDGMFMIGDAAHVIAPLAGDGIGMAMESAQLLASVMEEGRNKNLRADAMILMYSEQWRSSFRKRITIAKNIQRLLLSKPGKKASELALAVFPSLLSYMIERTRGQL
jgi:flavin-dependent dehydrogenase